MTPQSLNLIAAGFYIASAVCCIIALYFFFSLHIIEVFNDLTGRSVKKQLQRIRIQPQSQPVKPSLSPQVSSAKIKKSLPSASMSVNDREIQIEAGVYQNQGSEPTDVLDTGVEPTTLLTAEEATTILDSGVTTVLDSFSENQNKGENPIRMLKREVVIHAKIDPELKTMETDS